MSKHVKPIIRKAQPAGKKVIIIGATSGIGKGLALLYLKQGCTVGITGRRTEELEAIKNQYPDTTFYKTMDVTKDNCVQFFEELINDMGGMDIIVYCAGIGAQNPNLNTDIEINTIFTNVTGFARIIIYSYNYFKVRNKGHIVTISSLAGIRSLRQSPAYSATKRYQIHYTSCLAQKANKEKLALKFTTIVPGFIRTDMLKHKYPLTTSMDKGTRLIYNAIELKRRYTTIPGKWRWVEIIWRAIPNSIWERIW